MNASRSKTERILALFRKSNVVRPRDLDAIDVPRRYMSRLAERGNVMRVGRGLYVLPTAEPSSMHTMVQAAKRVPQGVVCLLSALQFHELTTQIPYEVWMAIHPKARKPRIPELGVRFVRFSGPALEQGVNAHTIEGVSVSIYSAAKTVADCFKYRNKIGLDVAIEALRDYRRRRDASMDELWKYAKVCRVTRVMRPYMEAIV